jgi:hypothetical protein
MLSDYELSCGYVESAMRNKVQVKLWKEHGVYHIRAHDFNSHARIDWKVYPELKQARACFDRMVCKHILTIKK